MTVKYNTYSATLPLYSSISVIYAKIGVSNVNKYIYFYVLANTMKIVLSQFPSLYSWPAGKGVQIVYNPFSQIVSNLTWLQKSENVQCFTKCFFGCPECD